MNFSRSLAQSVQQGQLGLAPAIPMPARHHFCHFLIVFGLLSGIVLQPRAEAQALNTPQPSYAAQAQDTTSAENTQDNSADNNDSSTGLPISLGKTASDETLWVVEMMQIAQRAQIAQEWRKLREHYPDWMIERFVVARAVAPTPTLASDSVAHSSTNKFPNTTTLNVNGVRHRSKLGKANSDSHASNATVQAPAPTYMLYVGNFSSIEQGEAWCDVVRDAYPACQVLPSEAIGGRSTRLRMTLQLTTPDMLEITSGDGSASASGAPLDTASPRQPPATSGTPPQSGNVTTVTTPDTSRHNASQSLNKDVANSALAFPRGGNVFNAVDFLVEVQ
ncbi:MAG: hypothetical protein HYZ45_08670, partial [Burkholderiales bacterium]|nr:hypothetical protein [Burkholderiales bacterium]